MAFELSVHSVAAVLCLGLEYLFSMFACCIEQSFYGDRTSQYNGKGKNVHALYPGLKKKT